jgi:RecB family exonuclease
VTWLNGFLAVENSHESVSQELAPGDFDRAGWQMAHTAMVNEARERWEGQGRQVFTERQNGFSLRGDAGTLGGRPDLIARRGDAGTIIDVKTGKDSPSHIVQVMLYMYAVPRAIRQHQGVVFDGQVAYTDHAVDIPAAAVDDKFVERLSQLIGQLASDAPARRVPSPGECRFCPITAADCPDRAAEDGFEEGVTTDF